MTYQAAPMPGLSFDRVKRNCFLLSFLIFLDDGDIIIAFGFRLSRLRCGFQLSRWIPLKEVLCWLVFLVLAWLAD